MSEPISDSAPRSIKDTIADDVQKAKRTGGTRVARIRSIVQDAAVQSLAEVKEGSGEIRAIAHETLTKTLNTVAENLQEPQNTPEPTEASEPQPATLKGLIAAIIAALKTRLFNRVRQEYTGVKQQVTELDSTLTDRYGDRYETAKQWYSRAKSQVDNLDAAALQQKQAELEAKAGDAGAALAQKEEMVKQQLKKLFHSAVAKR